MATRCELLRISEDGKKYFVPKVPLAEYLIGISLADNARVYPDAPETLINTFQPKVVWRPWLHDILDYTFDVLWHSSERRLAQWGNELLAWTKGVGQKDATRSQQTTELTQSDLMYPFHGAVLRWRTLDSSERTAERHGDLAEAVKACLPALTNGLLLSDLTIDFRIYEKSLIPLMKAMIAEFHLSKGDKALQQVWRDAIEIVAGCVAFFCSRSRLAGNEQYRLAERDEEIKSLWREVIRDASDRVSKSTAEDLVQESNNIDWPIRTKK